MLPGPNPPPPAKKAGHHLTGSVRIPIHFAYDFAEIYETIIFLA
jgi:hypothetical protein